MVNTLQGIRVARVSTISFSTLTQLCPQLEAIHQEGGEVTVIASQDSLSHELRQLPYCSLKPIFIARKFNFFADIVTVVKLWQLFREQHFDIVHSITPKAGFLCALAALAAGTPIRLHTYTGQPWVTMFGVKKTIVKYCDKLTSKLNTRCYTDSFSQRDFLVTNQIVQSSKIKVLGSGSLAGIDLRRFCQDNFSTLEKNAIRQSLNLKQKTRIFLFVGRITQDKGIDELLSAFGNALAIHADIALLIVGPFEKKVELILRERAQILAGNKVIFTGFSCTPERFMAIADILCIPSYREGFGTVVIEAAAMGVPAVGTRIYGLSDAIIDGETGLLVEPKNVAELTDALLRLISDEELRKQLGKNAKQRAINEFDSKKCGALLVREYEDLLK